MYARYLEAAAGAPIRAYFAWKAESQGGTTDQFALADAQLSSAQNPFETSDRNALTGGAIVYQAHCVRCHGEAADGRGSEMAKALPTMDFHSSTRRLAATRFKGTAAKWFTSVLKGKTSRHLKADGTPFAMPAFEGGLAREQIWLAITYLVSADADFPASESGARDDG